VFRLYHDEDALEGALVSALGRAGFDCLTVNEAGMRGQPDEQQLAFATNAGRVLYTKNTEDFCRLDRQWRLDGRRHAGIIVLTDQRTPIGVQLRALQAMAWSFTATDMADRLSFLLNHA
jgi:hypothetical protein